MEITINNQKPNNYNFTAFNSNNLFLHFSALPRFAEIKPQMLTAALDESIEYCQKLVKEIAALGVETQTQINWINTIKTLEEAMLPLSYAWGVAHHISSVCDSQEWKKVINDNIERVTTVYSLIGQNEDIYKHYKTLLSKSDELNLNATQIKILKDAILGFKLSGAELDEQSKQQFLLNQNQIAALTKKISDNVLYANDKFSYIVTADKIEELDGVPQHILNNLKQEDGSYKLTLHSSVYAPIMQYASNRNLREALYKASITRASDIIEFSQGELQWNNSLLIIELLKLRQHNASLIGYKNFAQVSLADKMAQIPEKVIDFIENIATKARVGALNDLSMLQKFSLEHGYTNLEPWDVGYIAELLRQQEYSFSEQEVQLYFSVDKVLSGLFNIINKLFNVNIKEDNTAQIWHEDVRFFNIYKNEQIIASFYLDLYSREGKKSGAWMNNALDKRYDIKGQNYKPAAYIICNFAKSINVEIPSTITHNDVITLFHEFGHGLHHMLTNINESAASGINGVEWDAVELPSQFMENFCWEYDVLKDLSQHINTQQELPLELFNKMLAAKNFLSGLGILRQITFSMLDMQAHLQQNITDINSLAKSINDKYHVIPQLDINRWANTFTHVFAGGYAAGYYSYHWAEVLSSDVFSVFEQQKEITGSVINPQICANYEKSILQRGGSRPALENFIEFMGREPSIDAFLRHNGL